MQDLQEQKELWGGLLSHPAWKQLCEWAEEQKAHRIARILSGDDSQREEDRNRGEVFGIGLFVEYPRTILEAIQVELDSHSKEK